MSKVLDFIKEHPVGMAVGAGGLVLLYFYSSSGSNSAATTDPNTAAYLNAQAAEVQAGQQFQTAQLQANQAALVSNNQAAVANNQITGQEVVAQLQSQDTLAGIGATAATQQNADTLSAQTTQAVSILQAQVAENTLAAQVATAQINAAAYTTIAEAPYQSADYIAAVNANSAPAGPSTAQVFNQLQAMLAPTYNSQNETAGVNITNYINQIEAAYPTAANTNNSIPIPQPVHA